VNVWRQQKLDDLRRALAGHLARRGELAADPAQANTLRTLDDTISEHCTAIAKIERQLKATP
jgi:hypothetical protein